MKNKPSEHEKGIAQDAINEAFGGMTIDPDLERAFSKALAKYRVEIARDLIAELRAELRPEPTAGDRRAAEKLFGRIMGYVQVDLKSVGGVKGVEDNYEKARGEIADALSAARGNRAELEAATREFFEAEELEYAAETRTCPQSSMTELNEARDRRKAAHDTLAAQLEVKA